MPRNGQHEAGDWAYEPWPCVPLTTHTEGRLRSTGAFGATQVAPRWEGASSHGSRARKTALGSVIGATNSSVAGRSVQVMPCRVKVPF